MQKPKHLNEIQERPPGDWNGLGNRPRNENLAKIRGLGTFEKEENDQEKESELIFSNRYDKYKRRERRR